MNKIDELKKIVASQKTIRTTRLAPILKEIEFMYIQIAKKNQNQSKEYAKLDKKYRVLFEQTRRKKGLEK